MYILLRYLFIYISVFSTMQAATADKEIPAWQKLTQQKLMMPCEQAYTTVGTPKQIAYHPTTGELIVLSVVQNTAWSIYSRTLSHCIEKYGPHASAKLQYLHDKDNVIALTITPEGEGIIEKFGERLRLSVLADPTQSIGIRVKHNANILANVAATPTGHMLALQSRNKQSGQNYIGLCTTADRTIETIKVGIPPHARIKRLAIAADGLSLAWSTNQGTLYTMRADAHSQPNLLIKGHNISWQHLAWSPDGSKLATTYVHKVTGPIYRQKIFALICAASGKVLTRHITESPVTACTFLDNTRLAVSMGKFLQVYALHADVQIDPALFSGLDSVQKAICAKTSICVGPYKLRNKQERDAYARLPAALQKPWLFTGTHDPADFAPAVSTQDATGTFSRIADWVDEQFTEPQLV